MTVTAHIIWLIFQCLIFLVVFQQISITYLMFINITVVAFLLQKIQKLKNYILRVFTTYFRYPKSTAPKELCLTTLPIRNILFIFLMNFFFSCIIFETICCKMLQLWHGIVYFCLYLLFTFILFILPR